MKHKIYRNEDIKNIDDNEEIIMYRATAWGGMGEVGTATIIFKSKNILEFYFGPDFEKLQQLAEFTSKHVGDPYKWINVNCGFQTAISIQNDYIEITKQIISDRVSPGSKILDNFNALVKNIDNIDISKPISEMDLKSN